MRAKKEPKTDILAEQSSQTPLALLEGDHFIQKSLHRYKNFGITFLDQAIVSGVNFLTGILLARFLGIDIFGVYTLVWMVALFLYTLQSALIISPMMSLGPKQNKEDEPHYYGSVVMQQGIFSVTTCLLLFTGLYVLNNFFPDWRLAPITLPLISAILTYQLQEFLRRYFFTRQQPKQALISDSLGYLGQILWLIILFLSVHKIGLTDVLWINAITSVLGLLPAISLWHAFRFSGQHFKTAVQYHWTFSKWLLGCSLLEWTSNNFLPLSAGWVLGAWAVGILKACQNILAVAHILFYTISNRIPVKGALLLAHEGLTKFESYYFKVTWRGALATILLTLPAFCFPELTLKVIYGASMSGQGHILFMYAWVYLLVFSVQILCYGLRTLEETRVIFITYLISTFFILGIVYPQISKFGIISIPIGFIQLYLIETSLLLIFYFIKRKSFICKTSLSENSS